MTGICSSYSFSDFCEKVRGRDCWIVAAMRRNDHFGFSFRTSGKDSIEGTSNYDAFRAC
jgi:hypothetical protein